jgi:hypothetical protein
VLQDGSASMTVQDVRRARWARSSFLRTLRRASLGRDRLAMTVFARMATPENPAHARSATVFSFSITCPSVRRST